MTQTPLTRRIGDREVSAIGLGAMTITRTPGYDLQQGIRTIHAALDLGVTLIDTADSYGPGPGSGVNESAVGRALADYGSGTEHVLVATKGGHIRTEEGWLVDGSPEHLRRACQESVQRLGVDSIPLYQHHRPDPKVPYEETMGALKELHEEGLVERVGVSNADSDQIRLAHRILGPALMSVQNEFSLHSRSSEPEMRLCEELDLAFLVHSPFGGAARAKHVAENDGPLARIAYEYGVSPQSVILAWILNRSPRAIPIPGASRPASVQDSFSATTLRLSAEEYAELDTEDQR